MNPPKNQPLGHILSISWDVDPEGSGEIEEFQIGVMQRGEETFLTLHIPGKVPPFAKAYSFNDPIARALLLVSMQYDNLVKEVDRAVEEARNLRTEERDPCSV